MKRIANRNARRYVDQHAEFQGSNLYARWDVTLYIVFSYGDHWPLLVFDTTAEHWVHNATTSSPSTKRHATQVGMRGSPLPFYEILRYIDVGGMPGYAAQRILDVARSPA